VTSDKLLLNHSSRSTLSRKNAAFLIEPGMPIPNGPFAQAQLVGLSKSRDRLGAGRCTTAPMLLLQLDWHLLCDQT